MSLARNSSETDAFILIKTSFICIFALESFDRIKRIARSRVRNVVGAITSEKWEDEKVLIIED